MLLEAGQMVIVRNVAHTDNQVVIFKLVMVMIRTVSYFDSLLVQVNPLHVTLKELNTFKELPDWIDDMCHVQVACGNLVQHRCEKEEIVVIDQRDFHVGIACNGALNFECGIEAAKTAAQNDNAFFHTEFLNKLF